MKRISASIGTVLALMLLAGCSSAPTRFYTLVSPSTATPATGSAGYRFELLPVTIPAQVDQPQLVVRQSDDQVALLEGEQWIGPLAEQIQTAVSDDLQGRLGVADVYGLPHAGSGHVFRIKLDVRRFESMPGRYALVSAAWSVRGEDAKRALECTTTAKQPVADGYAALVQGHQQALASLSGDIATVVRQLAAGGSAACPSP